VAKPVLCTRCGKRFLVPDSFTGRVRCPHCSRDRRESVSAKPAAPPTRKAPATETPRRAVSSPGKPDGGTPAAASPTGVKTTMRSAGKAWEEAARRRRQTRQWPPPRDARSKALSRSLRERALGRRSALVPYLILIAALAAALFLFAALAVRYGGPDAGPRDAGVADHLETSAHA